FMEFNMDANVDPCDNFYQYACGGWLKKNIIPETTSRYSTFDILRDELEVILKGVLEKTVEGEAAALTKAKTLYKSCTNESLIELRGGSPLLDMLPDVSEWPIAVDNWETNYGRTWRLEDVIAKLNEKYGTLLLVNFFVGTDDRDSTSHIIHVGVCLWQGKELTSLCSYSKSPHVPLFTEGKKKILYVPQFAVFISHRYFFLIFIFFSSLSLGGFKKKQQLLLKLFDWSYFTVCSFKSVSVMEYKSLFLSLNLWGRECTVLIALCEYDCFFLNMFLSTHRDLQNYMVWRFAMNMVVGLSRAYRDTRKAFRKALSGTTSEAAVWRQCALYVNNNLENAVGRLYVQEAFSEKSKELMEEMIKGIREVFISNLDDLTWMDAETKKAAEEKVLLILLAITVNDCYTYSAEEYFENILQNLEYVQKKRLRKLRVKVNKEEWVTGAAVVNAFYSSSKNQIVFPAGILQPPFFSKGQAKSLNYGGIGMVIGHEITHGFDDNGRNYDKDGDLKDWWTPDSTQRFLELSKCIVDQYGNFSWDLASGLHLNGNNTLGENIADNGGIRQAYKNYVKQHGEEPPLPGIDLSHDQLFFLNFAQVWCGTHRPEQAVNSIKVDVHSPGKFRVLGSLQNFPEFAKAFNCNKSSYMVPDNICRVW
uniref:Neprilysin n=1 Tax=Astatotilapia calliptera TaxID=8154 RepID=A0AAX7V6K7_ASTCA